MLGHFQVKFLSQGKDSLSLECQIKLILSLRCIATGWWMECWQRLKRLDTTKPISSFQVKLLFHKARQRFSLSLSPIPNLIDPFVTFDCELNHWLLDGMLAKTETISFMTS